LGNVYSLMIGQVKHLWLAKSAINEELETIRLTLKKLSIESCLKILDVAIIKCIGVHTKNYAVM
jgi:hypothetical protein